VLGRREESFMRKMRGIRSAVLHGSLPGRRKEGGEVLLESGACVRGRWDTSVTTMEAKGVTCVTVGKRNCVRVWMGWMGWIASSAERS